MRCAAYRTDRALWRFLLEELPPGSPVRAREGRVEFDWQGQRISVRSNKADFFIFNEIYRADDHGVAELPERLGTVIDLGGNIGLFSGRVAARAERVLCVEPVSTNLAVARANVEGCGAPGRVTLLPLAIGARSGEQVRIHLSEITGLNSTREEFTRRGGIIGVEDVETISLEDLFSRHGVARCDLLKCDVEGAEFDVFLEAPREVLARIDRLAMEVHLTARQDDVARAEALTRRLEEAGLRCRTEGETQPHGPGVMSYLLHATR